MSINVRAAASLLNISICASAAEKKAAFRAMAKKWHPDLHQGKPTAAEAELRFKQVLAAYEVVQSATAANVADGSASSRGVRRGSVRNHGPEDWARWHT